LGILVDCKRYKTKVRQTGVSCPPPVAPVVPPAQAGPVPSGFWIVPVVALGLGLLFVLSVAAGSVHGWLMSPSEAAIAQPTAVVAAAPASQDKQPVAHKQPAVAPAKVNVKAPTTPPPPKDPAPSPKQLLPLEIAAAAVTQPAGTAVEDLGSLDNRVEVVRVEPAPGQEPVKDVVTEPVPTANGDTCTTGTCKGTGDFCGTTVTFLASPKIAGDEALKEHKLLFVLHVSGNFEDPGFT
jgi:hypothetical protein